MRDPGSPRRFKGYCIDMFDQITKMLGVQYQIIEDTSFGQRNEQGRWNGVVQKLLDREVHVGLGTMSVTSERETAVDFTMSFYDLVGIAILMRVTEPPSSLFKFLTVLETNVWFCIFGAYLFTR